MNPYLTPKGAARPRLELPAASTCAAFFAAAVRATFSLCGQKNLGAAAFTALCAALALLPVLHAFRAANYRACAQRAAEALARRREDSISLEKLVRILPEGCTIELLEKLLAKGYLQRLHIDRKANRAQLSSAEANASQTR